MMYLCPTPFQIQRILSQTEVEKMASQGIQIMVLTYLAVCDFINSPPEIIATMKYW